MPFPPKGLKAMEYPLKHRFDYSFGLSASTATMNSTWVTLVRHSTIADQTNVKTILVNPSNASQDVETGALCTKHSIINNMKIIISAKKSNVQNSPDPIKFSITPFFASFEAKYDVADEDTGVTVAAVMQLAKDAAKEDVVPISVNKLPVIGNSDKSQPLSTVNHGENFDDDYEMTTNATMEDCAFDMEAFHTLLQHGSANIRGALKACLGRTRHYTLDNNRRTVNLFLKKFVPRAVRRILPFGYFGLLFHMPVEVDIDSYYADTALTVSTSHIGFRVLVRYDEWNELHDNTM